MMLLPEITTISFQLILLSLANMVPIISALRTGDRSKVVFQSLVKKSDNKANLTPDQLKLMLVTFGKSGLGMRKRVFRPDMALSNLQDFMKEDEYDFAKRNFRPDMALSNLQDLFENDVFVKRDGVDKDAIKLVDYIKGWATKRNYRPDMALSILQNMMRDDSFSKRNGPNRGVWNLNDYMSGLAKKRSFRPDMALSQLQHSMKDDFITKRIIGPSLFDRYRARPIWKTTSRSISSSKHGDKKKNIQKSNQVNMAQRSLTGFLAYMKSDGQLSIPQNDETKKSKLQGSKLLELQNRQSNSRRYISLPTIVHTVMKNAATDKEK